MSCKIVSGSQFHHLSPNSTRNSVLESCSTTHLSFNLSRKPRISIKTSSGSLSSLYRTTTRTRSTTINSLYATAPPKDSFYEVLGIPETGSLPEIKKAYKQLARKYHPDVSPPDQIDEYTETFIRVQEAYETLSDPKSRTMYDRDLSKGFHLDFSTRRRGQYDQGSEYGSSGEWKGRWQSQVNDLKQRSMNVNARGSWGARMRRQRVQRIEAFGSRASV